LIGLSEKTPETSTTLKAMHWGAFTVAQKMRREPGGWLLYRAVEATPEPQTRNEIARISHEKLRFFHENPRHRNRPCKSAIDAPAAHEVALPA
jgi:hypothetical protein